ncbi:hypothetical protein INP57_19465 [Saccharopolyspora sp. HNM0986]|uniref:hypothetical protein n=1 Tax=Saccharopolyspora galaxeae TaxID=2781241 RepID=UPI00190D8C25|nr:hypothetical protein [Saccharopolyspora sp. HNM0986]MBK0868989.1 hypothetical protein [Saccharopolyspora sp. HNM0986]
MADRARVFLAAPFVQFMNEEGHVTEHWRQRLGQLREQLLTAGAAVFNAHHNEGWGAKGLPPEQCVPSDLRGLVSCDVVCAYVGNPVSTGVALELGWASLLRKPVVLAADEDVEPSPMLRGLASITLVEQISLPAGLDEAGANAIVAATLRLIERQQAWGPSPWRDADLDSALAYVVPTETGRNGDATVTA